MSSANHDRSIPEAGKSNTSKNLEMSELLRQAVESSQEPITIADAQKPGFPLVFVNRAFEKMSGYSQAELIGRSCHFLLREDTDQPGLASLEEALKNGESGRVELRNYRKDGTQFINQLTLSAIKNSAGQITHYVVNQRDVTAVNQSNALRQKQDEALDHTRHQLARRVQQLANIADMSVALATISNPKKLMQAIVDLTRDRFNLYHAHIYLFNEWANRLVLSAGAGEIGRTMVAEKRSIAADAKQSLVARAFRTRNSVMVNDVRKNRNFLPHPLLPETRSELATPLVVGEKVIGVLDVQSAEINAFDAEDGRIMLTLAAQMAIAIDHATNLAEVEESRRALENSQGELQQALNDLRAINEQMSQKGWADYLQYDQDGSLSIDFSGSPDLFKSTRATTRILPRIEHMEFPLAVGGLNIGQVDLDGAVEEKEEVEILVQEVLQRLGGHLENIRLSDQTRQALSESNTLYEISTRLNQAQSLDHIVLAVAETLANRDISAISFWNIEFDRSGRPVWQILRGSWRKNPAEYPLTLDARFKLGDYAINATVFSDTPQMVLIGDTETHPLTATDENYHHFLALDPFRAAAYLPLTAGSRLIGLLTIHWPAARTFTDREIQFLETLSAQIAPAVESLNLLSEAQVRADLGGKLSNISAALSTAQTEDDMVQAIADILGYHHGRVTLSYLLDDTLSADTRVEIVSSLEKGQRLPLDASQKAGQKLSGLATSQLWLAKPSEPVFIDNIASTHPVSSEIMEQASAESWRSLGILPLFSSGRWQGILQIAFEDIHPFTHIEREVLIALVEPLGAVVASRRAQLAQQAAQKRAEFLYDISRQLNEASSDLEAIMGVIGRLNTSPEINRATLMLFKYNNRQDLQDIRLAASWYSGSGPQPSATGTVYPLIRFPSMAFMRIRRPSFIDDTHSHPSVDKRGRAVFDRMDIRSLGILPLWVGDQQLGAILLQGHKPYNFLSEEILLFSALTPQLAVSVQNQTLLSSAQQRAQREQILREITEKVRRAPTVDLVLKTAASEVGRVFGRKAMVYFNQTIEPLIEEPTNGHDSTG